MFNWARLGFVDVCFVFLVVFSNGWFCVVKFRVSHIHLSLFSSFQSSKQQILSVSYLSPISSLMGLILIYFNLFACIVNLGFLP